MITKEYAIILMRKGLKNRLFYCHANSVANNCMDTASKYLSLINTLDINGTLIGKHNSWATDSFAFAFSQLRQIPRDWYDELYESMFGKLDT